MACVAQSPLRLKSRFSELIAYEGYKQADAKLGHRGREGVTWPTFTILGPPLYLDISWTTEARNCKFGMPMRNAIYQRRSIGQIETEG